MEANLTEIISRLEALETAAGSSSSNDGDNAWMLTSTALVYLMTPAVAFFYGGMVHRKNILGTLLLCFLCMAIVTFQWLLFGFSLAFGPSSKGVHQFGGGDQKYYVEEFGFWHNDAYASTYAFYTYCMFQCAFAVITPALISGAVVNKMKITSFCIFVLLWTTVVYDVVAFWVWNPEGWLRKIGSLDWAGGVVIHISSGFSAAVCVLFFDIESGAILDPQPAWTVLGGGLLWFGWLGFNGGSAGNAGVLASLSFLTTNAGAAAAACTWGFLEYLHHGRTSAPTLCVGAVVGLVVITPAAGYVRPGWALMMGVWGAAVVYGVLVLKNRLLKLDDPLDVWICHGMGGVVGALLTGLFAEEQYRDGVYLAGLNGSFYGHAIQFAYQLVAVVSVIAYACSATAIIMLLLKHTIGIKISKLEHALGMDGGVTALAASEARQKEALVNNVLQRALVIFSGAPSSEVSSLSPDEEGVLHEVFGLFDANGNGTITVDEFHKALSSMGLSRPKKDIVAMFAAANGEAKDMDFEKFKKMFQQIRRQTQYPQEQQGQRHAMEQPRSAMAAEDGVEMV